MDKQVKSIDIVFENCECYTVPKECIYHLGASIDRKSVTVDMGRYSEYPGASWLILELDDIDKISYSTNWPDGEPFKDRVMKYSDITHIYIYYEDGTEYSFSVPWSDDEYSNDYQHTKTNGYSILIWIDDLTEDELKEFNEHRFNVKSQMYFSFSDFFKSLNKGESPCGTQS